ncbi:MAG: hypothetical protein RBS88_07450 [Spongiibacteraceae bacterium]|jgi:hypothetical protein|nr:hypothetical protein [Spongiibacteraceae bacterium]
MKVKQLLLAACVSALVASPGFANKDMDPSDKAEKLQETLQLNDNQTKEVERILEQMHEQKEALKQKYTIAEYDEYKDDKKELMEKAHDQINDLLTDQQKQAFKTHLDSMKKKYKRD